MASSVHTLTKYALSAFVAFQASAARSEDWPEQPAEYWTENTFSTPPFSFEPENKCTLPETRVRVPFMSALNMTPVTIQLKGSINQETAMAVTTEMMAVENTLPGRPIRLEIDSPGGEVFWGNMIINEIRHIRSQVDVVCTGEAKSMAAVILLTHPMHKGRRLAQENCQIMTHAAYLLYTDGRIQKLDDAGLSESDRENLENIRRNFAEGLTASAHRISLMESFRYFTVTDMDISVQDALNRGMIDTIIPAPEMAGYTLPAVNVFMNIGEAAAPMLSEPRLVRGPEPASRP